MSEVEKKESEQFKVEAKNKSAAVLMPARFGLAEQLSNYWIANVEQGTTLENILVPAYWSHIAKQMRPYDHIEARADDGSWVAELLVLGSDRNWARVKLLQEYKLTDSDVSLTQAMLHEVKWKGPHHKHAVIRLSDNEIVQAGFDTPAAAASWMLSHEKSA